MGLWKGGATKKEGAQGKKAQRGPFPLLLRRAFRRSPWLSAHSHAEPGQQTGFHVQLEILDDHNHGDLVEEHVWKKARCLQRTSKDDDEEEDYHLSVRVPV